MHGGSAQFSDVYELKEDIGVGSYSICKRCIHRVTAMEFAVKVRHRHLKTTITDASIGLSYNMHEHYCSGVMSSLFVLNRSLTKASETRQRRSRS